ncbi:MAG: hypothetical protein DSY89_00170 [Deltaproteobacteria bacterium]|nr:MAG: hypothetical protein DSY89_00170 [Deltaproteobacteria bacterium]
MTIFVPPDFPIPDVFETDRIYQRIWTVNVVVKGYDAVMTSTEHLRKTTPFGPAHPQTATGPGKNRNVSAG